MKDNKACSNSSRSAEIANIGKPPYVIELGEHESLWQEDAGTGKAHAAHRTPQSTA